MEETQFTRTKMLVGEDKLECLKKSKVIVFGVGGVGGNCIIALARAGVGDITIVDNDTVSISNLNRQAVAYYSTVGKMKIDVMEKIIKEINPQANVTKKSEFVLPENVENVIDMDYDYIIDAIDTVSAKLAIAKAAQDKNIPIISSMGTGNKLNPMEFEVTDIGSTSVCPLCKVMRKECKDRGIKKLKVLYSKEKPVKVSSEYIELNSNQRPVPGSISFVPPAAGMIIASEVVKDIIKWQK